ncbi:alpha-amylase family glycosyl hydrolase [Prevotella communis]|uniref:alpha-amylase family glycosyl hydrolase n=1 Tax=Prevotella communis TaxID=2913614 RepID=UPI001EDA8DCE|nr:alpha-amylase family glycosyl hydrolase [Prevotella communis]UKK61335.1 alpha-amylase family glycosyl hydrolase [Prevotella communis]UKK64160.1 alpha-amylase family glycosyl hydrolase [Prevotella communis]
MALHKIIIYQVFTRLFGHRSNTPVVNGTIEENGCGKLNDFTPSALKKIRELGVTHIWYTGVIRHATMTDYSRYGIPRQHPAVVKGRAGSPYAITDYYDIDPDLAVDVERRMEEFERLVTRTHRAGLKMIIDFVPNHVARQYKSICKPAGVRDLGEDDNPNEGFNPARNNFYYCPGQAFMPYFDLYHGEKEPYQEMPARATGNDCFHNAPGMNDWYETVKLNYGVDYYAGGVGYFSPIPNTWQKMLDILLFWAGKGVDAFRCDMAEMVPADFWAWATAQVRKQYPDIRFIGEVYNPNEYRHYIASGFDYLYDKVGMYDAMRDVICHRRDTDAITWAWQQTDDIRDHMLYFLENHDEQRVASDFFAGSGEKAVPALVVNALMQQNPFMLYFGQEWGERGMDAEGFSGRDGRTTIFDYWSLQPRYNALTQIYNKVLNIARSEKAVSEGLMFDVMYANQQYRQQYAFLRKAGKETLFVVANFADMPVTTDITIPSHAFDYLNLLEKAYKAVDLLTGTQVSLVLIRDQQVSIALPPRGAVVYKF